MSRSPLRFATRRQIAALRALAHAQNDWLARLGTPRQSRYIAAPHDIHCMPGLIGVGMVFTAENRAWARAGRTFTPERLQDALLRHSRWSETRTERDIRVLRERVDRAESRIAMIEGARA